MSLVARAHGLSAAQLFQWRKAYMEGSLVAVGANETVVPASDLQDANKSEEFPISIIEALKLNKVERNLNDVKLDDRG